MSEPRFTRVRASRAFRSLAIVGFCTAVLTRSAVELHAQSGPGIPTRVERLAALGRLWVSIRYFHPFLAYRPIDWDSALVAAIPRVNAATDRGAYAAAVQKLLDALADPLTRLRAPNALPSTGPHEPDPRAWWTRDSVLVVSLRNYPDFEDYFGTRERLAMVADSIERARKVVFDLRPTSLGQDPSAIDAIFTDGALAGFFTPAPLRAPDQRGRLYSGFPPEDGTTSGGYFSGFYTVDGKLILPGDSAAGARRAVFLVDEQSQLPVDAIALRAAGRARIATVGPVSEAGMVRSYLWMLPDSLEVAVRLTELVTGGAAAVASDTVVPRSSDRGRDAGLDAAVALLQRPDIRAPPAPVPWTAPAPAAQRSPLTSSYPPAAERMIAALQIWAVGQYFFPYRDLTGEAWDEVLIRYLPRFEAARDSLEYGLAAAEMATRLHDSHVRVTSPALNAYFGVASPPVFVRMIEDQPVITHFTDDSAARTSGIRVGDVILAVDGEPVGARFRRAQRYIPASTPQALRRNAARRMLAGPAGSTIVLRVRSGGSVERTVTLRREERYWGGVPGLSGRTGPVFRILPGNIGYADLGRLAPAQVDSMFDRLRHTRAIVFDMRGYPQGTAWSIAPRLTSASAPAAARFSRPLAMSPDTTERPQYSFVQQLPTTSQWRYAGRTVMLIDERTLSQAEHTGLFLEAANGTKFIGTPTAGANGDVTTVVLPGGLSMSFSGHAVTHADGRQLQRVGLVPHLRVAPTIAGIRAGRDQVLERAVAWIESLAEP
ncbi:MAG: S41 family peptidase [Gemmatimonadales bacterium]